jgi:REP element-mobilizing transposase RayT
LKDHDYASSGFYFVTICADMKRCIFARVVGATVELTALGKIVQAIWIAIPSHFARVNLHAFVIMPNHVHGLIEIACQAGAQHAAPLQRIPAGRDRWYAVQPGSLSTIVRSFKAAVTRRARRELGWKGELWQRNYFERFLRDGQEFADANRYIAENPMRWEWDRENLEKKQALESEVAVAQHAAPLRVNTAPWN